MKFLATLIFTILYLGNLSSSAQIILPLTWTGGTGQTNSDVCGSDLLTITADTIPAGLTYKWYVNTYLTCNIEQLTLFASGVQTINVNQTTEIYCHAVDSLNQVQWASWPFAVYNVDVNDGICSDNPTTNLCFGETAHLKVMNDDWQSLINAGATGVLQWQLNGNDIQGANTMEYYTTTAGNYGVIFTTSCGSAQSVNTIQVSYGAPSTATISGSDTICNGESTNLTFQFTGQSPYTYYYSNGTSTFGPFTTGQSSQTISVSPVSSTTYTLTSYTSGSCAGTTSGDAVVTVINLPPPIIFGTTAFCQGQSTVLTAQGIYASYLWSTGATTQSINVNIAGSYTLTVSDINGCIATETIVVTVNPLPVPVITGNNFICQGTSTILTVTPGYASYIWSNGNFTSSNSVSAAGIYTVTVTDNNGCTGSAIFTLIVNSNPIPNITGNTTICQGSCTTLSAGSGYTSYLWSNGTVTPLISVCSSGIYWATVTNASGCSGSDSIVVIVNPNPIVQITGDTTICSGQTTILDPGAGYTNYVWSNGNTTQTITVSTLNTYTVTVTDANGCTGTDSQTITAAPSYPTILTYSGALGLCAGDSVQLFAQTPMNSFQWYKNNVLIAGAVSPTLWVSQSGKYHCSSVDANNCSAVSNQAKVAIVCFPPLPPSEKSGTISVVPDAVIFPNPSSNEFVIKFNVEIKDPVSISLYDLSGKLIFQMTDILNERELRIPKQKPGYYRAEINVNEETKIFRSLIAL